MCVEYSLYKTMKADRLQPTSNVELGQIGELGNHGEHGEHGENGEAICNLQKNQWKPNISFLPIFALGQT